LPRTPGQPDRFEKHLLVNGNIIAMWARDIALGWGAINDPSDDVRSAILRAKDRADLEKSKTRGLAGCGDNDIASLTKLLIVNQLKQLTGATQASPAMPEQSASSSSLPEYKFIEYEHWMEIKEHSKKFFDWWRAQPTGYPGGHIKQLYRTTIFELNLDINILCNNDEDGCPISFWCKHTRYSAGVLIYLRQAARRWSAQYEGLDEAALSRIEAAKDRERDRVESSDLDDVEGSFNSIA
jgi:hypothetical protein